MREDVIRKFVWITLVTLMALPASASAEVILRMTGKVAGGAAEFDRAALQSLPEAVLHTSTVVTDGVHHFTGFLMRDLLDHAGAKGERVIATALNGYTVDIPISDFTEFDVIVAMQMDDAPLTRDDKGPLWIVYPRDDHPVLQDIRHDYRWVWQLSGLEVQ